MQHNRVEARRRHAHCCDFLSFAGLGDAVSRSPGEPRGIVGGKENSDAGEVVRLPVATERRACDRRFSKSLPMMPPLCVPSVSTPPGWR